MRLLLTTFAALFVATSSAFGHVVFLVPVTDGSGFDVVFNDSPQPDVKVRLELFSERPITCVAADGTVTQVSTLKPADGRIRVATVATTTYSNIAYGVVMRGDPNPILLTYHPKAVRSMNRADTVAKPVGMPLEVTATTVPEGICFTVTESGKPVANQEVQLFQPGGSKPTIIKTDAAGRTQAFSRSGDYAARVYRSAPDAGEHQGRRYLGVRRYATLTVRFDGGS